MEHYCQYMLAMEDDCHAVSEIYDDSKCCGKSAHFQLGDLAGGNIHGYEAYSVASKADPYDNGRDATVQLWLCAEHYDLFASLKVV
jgi:hypothetical protein